MVSFLPSPLPRTLAACLRDVEHPTARVRLSAVVDLGAHAKDARDAVVTTLEKALRDESADVRAAAARGLSDASAVEALSALLFAIEDDHPEVRQMALAAVGELGDRRAYSRLHRALSDERPEVRFQAVIAFARVAPEEAVPALTHALDDGDAEIRYIAIRMLEELTHGGTGFAQGEQAALVKQVRLRLDDPAVAVRVASAILLARGGLRDGVPLLSDVVERRITTPHADDEAEAVELAGELGLAALGPALERRAFRYSLFSGRNACAYQATIALARMGHTRACAQILRGLDQRSADRRASAVVAAGRAKLEAARARLLALRDDPDLAPGIVGEALTALDGAAGVADTSNHA